jgi:hypothetical protein
MTLSLRDVRERLGFKPVKVFRAEQRERLKKLADESHHLTEAGKKELMSRQMGKTTEMLLKAVHAASKGHRVFITGHTPFMSKHWRDQAREFCHRLSIDPSQILSSEPGDGTYRYPELKVFHDHYQQKRD